MLKKIRNKILLSISLAAIIYLGFTIYFDYDRVLLSFKHFNWILLPVLLILSFLNYISRFFKWQYYLKLIEVKLYLIDSFSIFMSGLIMSITPGKMGELLKSYLIKQVNFTPISKTAPVVFAERVTDFLSLTIMALVGAYIFDYGKNIAIFITAGIIFIIILLTNKNLFDKLLTVFSGFKIVSRQATKIRTAYDSSSKLLSLKPLLLMTILSIISWGFEAVGFYLVLKNLSLNTDLIWAFFSYSFSTIVGALSMLPGGLGVTEGSLTFMLIQKGMKDNDAFAATFIIRAVTLWFAVFVGIISVLIYQKRFGQIREDIGS